MRIPPGLITQKAVAADLCVSRATLWRARQSNLTDFPAPVVIRNRVFWKKSDLGKLEDALLKFEGRGKFEQRRDRAKRIAALTKARPYTKRLKNVRRVETDERQQDLF